ncbi:prominin-1-A-like isoform X3 [Dunckerocampus dactyliophorus]|uniref:prominin-1-A-like isoform X3 n=1 Tax=Dunckerocampus dactyliophorus TaxID=161453 RepID=UPI002406D0CE|nr:prominin-1-A-like isoform X3 [Dunckerocampus dactyliophorus]
MMDSCRRARGWRWQGMFRTAVGLWLLQLCVAVGTKGLTTPKTPETEITSIQYLPPAETGDANFLAGPVHVFLTCVQPNSFPKEMLMTIIQGQTNRSDTAFINKVLTYEAGFLVFAVIGVIYIIVMPIVGLYLLFRGKCTEKYKEMTPAREKKRKIFYCSTLVTTIILLAGTVCMLKSNYILEQSMGQSQGQLNNTLQNITLFFKAAEKVIDGTLVEMKTLPQKLGDTIKPAVLKEVGFDALKTDKQEIEGGLNSLIDSRKKLVDSLNGLKDLNNRIKGTTSKTECRCLNLQPRTVQDIQALENLDTFKNTFRDFDVSSMEEKISKLGSDINIDKLEVPNLNIASQMQFLTTFVNKLSASISKYGEKLKTVEGFRWPICVVMCFVVVLVFVCNTLALILGHSGLTQPIDPIERTCMTDVAGKLFTIGVFVSFFFSWLLMLVTVVLFLVGGNVYSLLCHPWSTGELWQMIDTASDILQLMPQGFDVTPSGVYTNCANKTSALKALQLDKKFDITKLDKALQDIETKLQGITVSVDFSTYTKKLDEFPALPMMPEIDLTQGVNALDQAAQNHPDVDIAQELKQHAKDMRNIQEDIEKQMEEMKKGWNALEDNIGTLKDRMKKLSDQGQLNTIIKDVAIREIKDFIKRSISMVTEDFDCQPIAGFVDSAETILCSRLVESLNAFWFSLGWCIILFIPSTIFTMKLAKHYRKMSRVDIIDFFYLCPAAKSARDQRATVAQLAPAEQSAVRRLGALGRLRPLRALCALGALGVTKETPPPDTSASSKNPETRGDDVNDEE